MLIVAFLNQFVIPIGELHAVHVVTQADAQP
jgi:hypothetical protein